MKTNQTLHGDVVALVGLTCPRAAEHESPQKRRAFIIPGSKFPFLEIKGPQPRRGGRVLLRFKKFPMNDPARSLEDISRYGWAFKRQFAVYNQADVSYAEALIKEAYADALSW